MCFEMFVQTEKIHYFTYFLIRNEVVCSAKIFCRQNSSFPLEYLNKFHSDTQTTGPQGNYCCMCQKVVYRLEKFHHNREYREKKFSNLPQATLELARLERNKLALEKLYMLLEERSDNINRGQIMLAKIT